MADMVVSRTRVLTAEAVDEIEAAPLEIPAPPEIIEEPEPEAAPIYAEAEAGQLTLF